MGRPRVAVSCLTYAQVNAVAEAFLSRHHPSRQLPIPIEEIIDTKLGIDIVGLPGLAAFAGDEDDYVESYVNARLTAIFVDEDAYNKQTNRYRFSIAHELGHIEMHKAVFAGLTFSSLAEWRATVREIIPEPEYARLEWQAYAFAGCVLVPSRKLRNVLNAHIQLAMQNGMNAGEDDAIREHLEKRIGDVFAVSSAVIHKRIEKEGLSWRDTPI